MGAQILAQSIDQTSPQKKIGGRKLGSKKEQSKNTKRQNPSCVVLNLLQSTDASSHCGPFQSLRRRGPCQLHCRAHFRWISSRKTAGAAYPNQIIQSVLISFGTSSPGSQSHLLKRIFREIKSSKPRIATTGFLMQFRRSNFYWHGHQPTYSIK